MNSSETACRALREARRLELRYDGQPRIVEVHVVGWARDGQCIMRAWQVRGGSASGALVGWKMFRLNEARSIHMTDERSLAPRPGYNPSDPAMSGGIECRI